MPRFARSPKPAFLPFCGPPLPPRLLFLDDDPDRAEVFLTENPTAVWVQTAVECIARLEERWDEVHLDHDLGGEHFVDHDREDCGMEVVRWLCLHDRPHLKTTRFHIHSHNANAATMMGMQMMTNGYTVVVRPFGSPEALPLAGAEPSPRLSFLEALGHLLRRLLRREDYGYPASRLDLPRPDQLPLEHFDFDWMPPPAPSRNAEEGRQPDDRPEPD